MTGIDAIAAERKRQIDVEGWTAAHDEAHMDEELARAASYYAHPARPGCKALFPKTWDKSWDKKDKHDRLRQLAIAGALCAAEYDRLADNDDWGVSEADYHEQSNVAQQVCELASITWLRLLCAGQARLLAGALARAYQLKASCQFIRQASRKAGADQAGKSRPSQVTTKGRGRQLYPCEGSGEEAGIEYTGRAYSVDRVR